MYVRYTSTKTSDEQAWRYFFNDIAGLINGTITSASQFNTSACNTGASIVTGTAPSSGVYTLSSNNCTNTDASHNYYYRIIKKHYGNDGVNSFAGSRTIDLRRDRDWRFRLTAFTPTLGAAFPTSNLAHTWTNYTNASYKYNQIYYGFNEVEYFDLIINDYTFFICGKSTGGYTAINTWWGVFDQEFNSTIDNHTYGVNSDYSPQVGGLGFVRQMYNNTTHFENDTNFHVYQWGKTQYYSYDGTFRNSSIEHGGNYHYGYMAAGEGTFQATYPTFRDEVVAQPGANGETLHYMIPVQLKPHANENTQLGDARWGKLMHFYRTTDDIMAWSDDQGQVLLDGSTRYRIFKLHFTGDDNRLDTNSNRYGCYAFPEDNPA